MKAVAVFPDRKKIETVEKDDPPLSGPADVRLEMLEVGVCAMHRAQNTPRRTMASRMFVPPIW